MRYVALLVFLLFTLNTYGQTNRTADTLLPAAGGQWSLQVNTTRDHETHETLLCNYFPFNGPLFLNFCSVYYPFQEVLREMTIENPHTQSVEGFSFGWNGRTPYLADTLIRELTSANAGTRAKLHSLYRYVANNHLYFFAPDTHHVYAENYNASKFLNGYGYGHCGMIATGLSQLARRYQGQNQRFWHINGGSHGFSEVLADSGQWVCLDADQEGYYLLPDNRNLASFEDVRFDRYLYLRTKHFGRATPFNWDWNRHFFSSYNTGQSFYNNTDSALNTVEPCCPRYPIVAGEDILFRLPPRSVLSFFPNDTTYSHHYVQSNPAPTLNTVQPVIGRGQMTVNYRAEPGQPGAGLHGIDQVTVPPGDTVYQTAMVGYWSSLMIRETLPLVMHNGALELGIFKQSAQDSINIFFSRDSLNWIPLLLNAAVQPGQQYYNLDFLNLIQPNSSAAVYQYFIRMDFKTSNSPAGIRINQLRTRSMFQFSKFTGPRLRKGLNTLQLYAKDSLPLQLHLKWREDTLNHPPLNNVTPLFPANGVQSDSSHFTFQWTAPGDPDGDTMYDYQIQVSETPDMAYPIATLFERGLRQTNGGKTYFRPEIGDYLQAGRTYYWQVKAQDQRGLWGDWSPIWSFSVKGPAYPRNLHWDFAAGNTTDILQLRWEANPDGTAPELYEVYSGNERDGFFPADTALRVTTNRNQYHFHLQQIRKKHRVVAIDAFGNRSSASFQVNLPRMLTAQVGVPFDHLQIFHGNLLAQTEPWPTVGVSDRELFCLFDSTRLLSVGSQFLPLQTGFTKVDLCTRVGHDTVRVFQLFLKIMPYGTNEPYHTAPGLLITPEDTAVYAQNGLALFHIRYEGFVNGDDPTNLLTPAGITHGVTANTLPGLYNSFAGGASSTHYRIVHQCGLLTVKPGTPSGSSATPYPSGISCSPNPFKDLINVRVSEKWIAEKIRYRLCDVSGASLLQGELRHPGIILPVDALPQGLYLLHITDGQGNSLQQFKLCK